MADSEHKVRRAFRIRASSNLVGKSEAATDAAPAGERDPLAKAVARGVTEALAQFGIGVAAFGEAHRLSGCRTVKELTVLAQVSGAQCCCLAMGFDLAVAERVAAQVSAAITGDGVEPGTTDTVMQFLTEARSLARVRHRNVVEIYFAGTEGGQHFFAMELLPGPDLESLVGRQGALSPNVALTYLRQAAEGLQAANRAGITHCDVKPANLVLGADGWVRVADFGLARTAGTGPKDEETVEGSPPYMAPEQFYGHAVTHRTDIYSLGCTWYHLLTGHEPFPAADGIESALRHIHDPVPEVPGAPAVTSLLRRMMAKSPANRHADYSELLRDLAKVT